MFGERPNSTGTFGWTDVGLFSTVSGAFRGNVRGNEDASADWTDGKSSDNTRYKSATLDLSLSSSLYAGNKMQPAALQILACIRT